MAYTLVILSTQRRIDKNSQGVKGKITYFVDYPTLVDQ
jgi:hypothetical protein